MRLDANGKLSWHPLRVEVNPDQTTALVSKVAWDARSAAASIVVAQLHKGLGGAAIIAIDEDVGTSDSGCMLAELNIHPVSTGR